MANCAINPISGGFLRSVSGTDKPAAAATSSARADRSRTKIFVDLDTQETTTAPTVKKEARPIFKEL